MTSPSKTILCLPAEVLCMILSFLDPHDVFRLLRTCKTFQRVVSGYLPSAKLFADVVFVSQIHKCSLNMTKAPLSDRNAEIGYYLQSQNCLAPSHPALVILSSKPATALDPNQLNDTIVERVLFHGWTEVLRWFMKTPIGYMSVEVAAGNSFSYACSRGFLDMAKLLDEHFHPILCKLEHKEVSDHDDIFSDNLNGNFLGEDRLSAHYHTALRAACSNGHLGVVQWLCAVFNVTAHDVVVNLGADAFRCSCASENRHVAQWLMDTYALSRDHVSDRITAEFLRAISPTTLKWLVDADMIHRRVLVKCRSIIYNRNTLYVLNILCARGNYLMAMEIANKYEFTFNEIMFSTLLMMDAFILGDDDKIQWLEDKYNEYKHEETISTRKAVLNCFTVVCKRGCVTLAQRFARSFDVSPLSHTTAMYTLVETHNITTAKWLVQYFDIKHTTTLSVPMLSKACERGDLEMAKWILQEFNMDATDFIYSQEDRYRLISA